MLISSSQDPASNYHLSEKGIIIDDEFKHQKGKVTDKELTEIRRDVIYKD